jgi:hypothetical protein
VTPWSTPDLSNITQVLKGLLDSALSAAASHMSVGNIKTNCNAPDVRKPGDSQCLLTLYLLHVGRDPNWRNTPVQGSRGQLNTAQPLSLSLSYLLTAWCEGDFATEQRAMSIALQTFHSYPIVTQSLIQQELLTGWLNKGEFVVSIQADTIEEMSRLWQAFTVPMRLSALIKVSVVFLPPLTTPATSSIPPQTANLAVTLTPSAPAPTLPPASAPRLFGGVSVGVAPPAPGTDAADLAPNYGPLVAVGDGVAAPQGQPPIGGTMTIAGSALDQPDATDVYLSAPGGAPWNVTAWRLNQDANWLCLSFPNGYADPSQTPPPAVTPLPGLYNLCVGSHAAGGYRSNTIPLAIAPRVDGVSDPPTLNPNPSGVFSITGAGFVASNATKLIFAGKPLTYSGAGLAAGLFTVDAPGQTIAFMAPSGTTTGAYPVQLSVNGVAATVGWVATP